MNEPIYRVEVDWAPAYELVASLEAFASRPNHKLLDLTPAWVERAKSVLGPEATAKLSEKAAKMKVPPLLFVRQCPGQRDVESFLAWFAGLSPGELYERLAPSLTEGTPVPGDLGRSRDALIELLRTWNEHYFRTVDPAILAGLAAEAEARRSELPPASPVAYVETVTRGVYVEPASELRTVLLVPQYHFRPLNLYEDYRDLTVFIYPAEALPPESGQAPPPLLRAARALADESRLRILRFLAGGVRSFTDIAGHTKLSKSTVHHHMVTLRAAGMVRVYHNRGGAADRYGLRPGAVDMLRDGITEFLGP